MGFRDPIVGGTTLIRSAIHSPDYVPGVAGWTINGDGSAELNDVTIRGTVIAARIIGGTFGTSLTDPSLWLNEDGDDNSLRVYDETGNLVTQMGAGQAETGGVDFYDGDFSVSISGHTVSWAHTSGSFLLPVTQNYLNATGTALLWNTTVAGGVAFDAAHGALVGVVPGSDTLETWQTPTYTSAFAGGSTFGSTFLPFEFRHDAQDNIVAAGAFHALTAVSSATLCTLPAGYRPAKDVVLPLSCLTSGGAVPARSAVMQIQTNGTVTVKASAAWSISDNFYAEGFPRGNIA